MKIVFVVGLPGSGKTSYVNQYIKQNIGFQIICPDDVRASLGSPYEPRHAPVIRQVCDVMARAHLERGINVIVDATNLNLNLLKGYAKLAKEYKYTTSAVVLDTPEAICRERRADRIEDFDYSTRFLKWVYAWKELEKDCFSSLRRLFDEITIVGGNQ
ncbi:MAG: ATP-binding protein [Candidatus Peribacteraceae bacterium]|nr:ATP-binding protein [Candidatus Peribacteraceae bacterium]